MTTEQNPRPEIENTRADAEARLNQAMLALLSPMAIRQVTAREAYASMTRIVARIEGDIPTGARLVGLLQWFNAQRPAGVPPIPSGTAGVAQDCVAAYRKTLVRSSTAGVSNAALSPEMVEGLNHWLERLLDMMRDEIRRPYEAQAVQLRDSHAQELTALRQTADAELATASEAGAALELEIQQRRQQIETLQQQSQARQQRCTELEAALADSMRECRDLGASLAVQKTRGEESERRLAQSSDALRSAQSAADEERRQRLLAIDSGRVLEQDLVREKERRKAAESQARALQKYLEEEKERSALLQSAFAEIQRRPEAMPATPERRAQSRIKSGRRMSAPVPVRRKTLR